MCDQKALGLIRKAWPDAALPGKHEFQAKKRPDLVGAFCLGAEEVAEMRRKLKA